MRRKITGICGCGLAVAAIMLTACSGEKIEGAWVEPVPGMENMVQGVRLEAGGKASSINMATLQYEAWQREGDRLILSGKSLGNGQTIAFSDTLRIEELTADRLTLRRGSQTIAYQRQE